MTGDTAQVLKAIAQDQSGLRCQVNITLGGMPEPSSGASSLIRICVLFTYDPPVTVTFGVPGWATSKPPDVKWDSHWKLPVLFGT